MPDLPDELLAEAPVGAAVAALAQRNAHHLAQMTDEERADAAAHWRELALTVLTAAGGALGHDPEAPGPGRAVLVFEDSGEDEVAVHASFFPQLQEAGENEVVATPAQATALELLEGLNPTD